MVQKKKLVRIPKLPVEIDEKIPTINFCVLINWHAKSN